MRSLITVLAIGLVAAVLGGPPAASRERAESTEGSGDRPHTAQADSPAGPASRGVGTR